MAGFLLAFYPINPYIMSLTEFNRDMNITRHAMVVGMNRVFPVLYLL